MEEAALEFNTRCQVLIKHICFLSNFTVKTAFSHIEKSELKPKSGSRSKAQGVQTPHRRRRAERSPRPHASESPGVGSAPHRREGRHADGASQRGVGVSVPRTAALATLVKMSLHLAVSPALSPWGPAGPWPPCLIIAPETDTPVCRGGEQSGLSESLHLSREKTTFGGQLVPKVPARPPA